MSASSELATLPATATAAEIKEITDRDGGVIVKDVLSVELRARTNADVEPCLVGRDPAQDFGERDVCSFAGYRAFGEER